MSNENKTIYEFELKLISDFFQNMPRQGPGSPEATLKALSFIDNLTDESRIADLGCGTGGQTMTLAQHAPGQITGLDLFEVFIEKFNRNARNLRLQDRVNGIAGSMDNLPFDNQTLDLIWCEGAIYNIGFKRGIREWRDYLKAGGYLAVSESCWFTDERPAEIHTYWTDHYPEIDTISRKIAQIQQAGYVPVASFILPENCWKEHYFAPMKEAAQLLLQQYPGHKTAEEFVGYQQRDVELYRKYKSYYGYVFFIAKKIGE